MSTRGAEGSEGKKREDEEAEVAKERRDLAALYGEMSLIVAGWDLPASTAEGRQKENIVAS